jgi:biopolymer transport protein ExbD
VFFSLLTYTGAVMAMLTSYDLVLPPTVVTAEQAASSAEQPKATLLLAVKMIDGNLRVEHSEENGFRRDIPGMSLASMDTLEAVLAAIRNKYPQNEDILVVPSDEVSYDDVIKVLERARYAKYTAISLGARSRGTQVAAGAR